MWGKGARDLLISWRHALPFVASWLLNLFHLAVAILHLFPDLVYGRLQHRTTSTLVYFINNLGPTWILAFGVSGVLLTIGLTVRPNLVWISHALCGSIWMGYSAALWIGALARHPVGMVLLPLLATAPAAAHILMAIARSDMDEEVTPANAVIRDRDHGPDRLDSRWSDHVDGHGRRSEDAQEQQEAAGDGGGEPPPSRGRREVDPSD